MTQDLDPPAQNGIAITVAITVWKREQLLPHALQSVLRQGRPCVEILVLSDGRSPAARRIIEPFEERLPIRYIGLRRHGKWKGNHLRRQALEAASGSHVAIVGHDCLLYPSYLAAHLANIAVDEATLSVVPVDYWRGTRPDGRMPRHGGLMALGEGEIDLLCLAFPRRLALAADCFGEEMLRRRCADYLSFDRLRRLTPTVYFEGESQAAHF